MTKAEIERAVVLALAELRCHGGTEAEAEALRQWFKVLADNEDSKLTDKLIPS